MLYWRKFFLCAKKVMGEKSPLLGIVYFNASVLEARKNNFTLASRYVDSFSIYYIGCLIADNFYT